MKLLFETLFQKMHLSIIKGLKLIAVSLRRLLTQVKYCDKYTSYIFVEKLYKRNILVKSYSVSLKRDAK